VPDDGGGRAPRPGLDTQDTADQSEPAAIVADAADRRRRQVRRLAAIELIGLSYGQAAPQPTPAGPEACPPGCPGCRRRSA
jgi:hypothetical protein